MNRPSIATASKPTERERQKLERQTNYDRVKNLAQLWPIAAERFGETVALCDPHAKPEVNLTYTQMWDRMRRFAIGLQALGVKPGDRVALFSENNPRWFIADGGILTVGAVDVVRSSQADKEELLYILRNSESTVLVVENQKTLDKLRDRLDDLPIQVAILLSDAEPEPDERLNVLNFPQAIAQSSDRDLEPSDRQEDSLATLMYTSGTTGKPKGVMLTHGNLLHQVRNLGAIVTLETGDRVLSILPSWHVYERAIEYFAIAGGCTLIYTDLRHVKRDLTAAQPNYFVGVPRLFEYIYDEVEKQISKQSEKQQQLAHVLFSVSERYVKARRIANGLSLELQQPSGWQKLRAKAEMTALWPLHAWAERSIYAPIRDRIAPKLKLTICGGGTLTVSLDTFYEIIGLEVLVGYGLTETSPVLTARRPWHNLRGSAGKPLPGTEVRIADPETRETLPQGEKGVVLVRGPQVMQGYYRNPETTQKAIDAEGWFNTEDLGFLTVQEDLVLAGRAKDTIVLSNGENVEPQPIEEACDRSPYIEQIVVLGQDRRSLGALIVPDLDNLKAWANDNNVQLDFPENSQILDLENNQSVEELFRQELNREIKNRPGYSPNDRIGPFCLLLEGFSQENGMLTQTLKIKRNVVLDRYGDLIDKMFS